jgi:ubiquinone/menaquinone biosynthesis C-methylase UbiE
VIAQRAYTRQLLKLAKGEAVLDIGSGPGFLAAEMAAEVGPAGRIRGIDLSEVMVARSQQRNTHPFVSFAAGDASALTEPDASYDVVVSTQVAEYVPDILAFCAEAFRVLKPGGRAVILATDWRAIAWHSTQPDRMAAMMTAFAGHCADDVLPRTLGARLTEAGFRVTGASVFPILNRDHGPDAYSAHVIGFIATYVRRKALLPEPTIVAWEAEQRELAATGAYFFLSPRVFFQAERPA